MSEDTRSCSTEPLPGKDLDWIRKNRLFSSVGEESRQRLFREIRPCLVQAGERFLRRGDEGEEFYIIREGSCSVILDREGRREVVDRMGEGDIVGEMAVLTGEPRSADVVAETDAVLWCVSRDAFDLACEEHPDLRELLTNVLYTRFARALARGDLTIGKYAMKRILGRGGSSIVYHGSHVTLDMPVAVKMLRHNMAMDSTFVEEFRNEAKAIAQLNHDNIVKVYDVEELFRTFFIVMEYVEGRTLEHMLKKGDQRPLPQKLDILLQVCSGLKHAHDRGVVHRDIKPGNILVQEDGLIKIVDFGLACAPGTQSDYAKGSPYYASPEQIRMQPIDERSDLYSLGITAFELFTGEKPINGDSMKEILKKHLSPERPDPRNIVPDLPDELASFIVSAMSVDPVHRPPNVAEIMYELDPLARRLGLTPPLGHSEPLNMMSLNLFYRESQSHIMKKLVKELMLELEKVGARLRGTNYTDINR